MGTSIILFLKLKPAREERRTASFSAWKTQQNKMRNSMRGTWMKVNYSWCIFYADYKSQLENTELAHEISILRTYISNKPSNSDNVISLYQSWYRTCCKYNFSMDRKFQEPIQHFQSPIVSIRLFCQFSSIPFGLSWTLLAHSQVCMTQVSNGSLYGIVSSFFYKYADSK